jgi:hypothetical protein
VSDYGDYTCGRCEKPWSAHGSPPTKDDVPVCPGTQALSTRLASAEAALREIAEWPGGDRVRGFLHAQDIARRALAPAASPTTESTDQGVDRE